MERWYSRAMAQPTKAQGRAQFVLRVRILSALMVLAAGFLTVRLYFIQIVHGDDYRKAAMGQYVEDAGEDPKRGDIFFSKKNGELVAAAVMQGGWRIAINPKQIENIDDTYLQLSGLVEMDKARFYASAEKKDDPYEEVAFRVDDTIASEVRSRKIPGVITVRDEWRFYPGEDLASHALGFVAFRGDVKAGVYGLERYWEDTLRQDEGGLYVNPFAEIFTNMGAAIASSPESYEGSIVTSLEPAAQRNLEDALQGIVEKHSPKLAGGIVMDPKSGEIVAMALAPTFDPNTYNVVDDVRVFSNPMVEGVYEMGSIVKPLTVAAGIDAGVISPRTTYNDAGFVKLSGETIRNFDGRGRGVVPMQEVLSQSLNTGIAFIVEKIGNERFAEYLKKFQLDQETGIDLPAEIAGKLGALEKGADVDYASAGFGQGVAFTPIATIRALAALANEGKLPEPHIVRAIKYETGVERKIETAPETTVLKPESAQIVTDMLVKVFDDALLDGELKQEHYSIAAKTGTAQIAIPGGGGYYADRYLHSFFGYFPAHEPRFIVLLYAVELHGEMYASRTLARPFLDIAKFLINYYNIPPDR